MFLRMKKNEINNKFRKNQNLRFQNWWLGFCEQDIIFRNIFFSNNSKKFFKMMSLGICANKKNLDFFSYG